MDEFFETLGKRISDTVEELGKKAGDTLDIQKLKNQISALQRANDREFKNMGKKLYEEFRTSEMADLNFIETCEEIEKREEQIEGLNQAIERIKGE